MQRCVARRTYRNLGVGVFMIAMGAVYTLPAQAGICTLSWGANTETDLAGYQAYQTVAGVAYGTTPAWIGNVTSVTCEQLGVTADGQIHYFVVKAYDTAGNVSGPSNEVSIAIPLPVTTSTPTQPPPAPSCLRFAGKSGNCKEWSP